MLPHRFPFRLVEPLPGRGLRLLPSAGAARLRGEGFLSPFLALEAMAQAALAMLPAAQAEDGRGGLLAGVEGLRFHERIAPGVALVAGAELLGRFGRLVKARVWLEREGEEGGRVADGELLLALDE